MAILERALAHNAGSPPLLLALLEAATPLLEPAALCARWLRVIKRCQQQSQQEGGGAMVALWPEFLRMRRRMFAAFQVHELQVRGPGGVCLHHGSGGFATLLADRLGPASLLPHNMPLARPLAEPRMRLHPLCQEAYADALASLAQEAARLGQSRTPGLQGPGLEAVEGAVVRCSLDLMDLELQVCCGWRVWRVAAEAHSCMPGLLLLWRHSPD